MDWENVFSKHKTDRLLVPRLYEELTRLKSIKKRNNTHGWKFGKTGTLKDKWIENKNMKKWPTSSFIRKMPIKTTIRSMAYLA